MNSAKNLTLNLKDDPSKYPSYFKKVYDNNCLTKKKIYIRWVDDISKKYKSNIYWWSLAHVNKYNYTNKIYHYFVLLESVKHFKNSNKFKTIIIDKAIHENVFHIKFKYKKKIIIFDKKTPKIKYFQILKFFLYNFIAILFLKLFSKKKFIKSKLVLIDCFIYNYKKPDTGFINSLKINRIMKKNYFFVPTFAYINYFLRFLLLIKLAKKKNYLFKEQFLNFKNLFEIIKIIKFSLSFKDKIKRLNNWKFDEIILIEMKNFSEFESIIYSVLNYNFAKNLKKDNYKIHRSINYFENQFLDKGWNLGFNTFYGNKVNIGYQAFSYLPEAFNTSPSKQEFEQKVCPQKIIVKGKGFIKLISENCNKINCVIGPSFKSFDITKFNKKKTIKYLFLLTGVPIEDKKIFEQILLFKKINYNKTIGLKPHPISIIPEGIFKNFEKNNIEIFTGDIAETLQISNIIISAGLSTSLVEALIYNCKLIINSDSIYDKLFFKKLYIPKKSYFFTNNIYKANNTKLHSLNLSEKLRIIDNYFAKYPKKNLINLTENLK
tara:strand:+ start:4098 stop:5738 length:1641 start_codon:yes stop_codon:yes gene_type:complete